jgi:hypothetical protein
MKSITINSNYKTIEAIFFPRQPVIAEKIYTALALFILIGILQKPILILLPPWTDLKSSVDFCILSTTPPRRSYPITRYLNSEFQNLYVPQDISTDESLIMWNGCLTFKQLLPLKSLHFGIKKFELHELKSCCLESFVFCTGKTIMESPFIT